MRNYIIKFIMQTKFCDRHQRSACIVDLDLSQLVCQRCALFDPLYSAHKFIDIESLPKHAIQLYRQFQKDISSLCITVDKDAISNWRIIDQLAIEIFKQKSKQLNVTYDQMVAEIERERKQSMTNLEQKINRIVSQSNQSVNYLVREKYHQLYCKNKYLDECIREKKYLQVTNELLDKTTKLIIADIQKQLSIIEIDLRHKFQALDYSQLPEVIPRRATFGRDEMLLPIEQKNNEVNQVQLNLGIKTERIIISEQCKLETLHPNPQTDRASVHSAIHQKDQRDNSVDVIEQKLTTSLILHNPKNTKQLATKAELKNIVLKNTIKQVIMNNLQLNNRQALQAIRKCTLGTFVSRIELSGNQLTSQLLVLLKKQKIQSKYLKNLVVKGIKLDERMLKKQGFNVEKINQGKLQLGDITIDLL